jgi:hypothetical protein
MTMFHVLTTSTFWILVVIGAAFAILLLAVLRMEDPNLMREHERQRREKAESAVEPH